MGPETLAQSKQGRSTWEGWNSAVEDLAGRFSFAQPAEGFTPKPVTASRRRESIGAGSDVEHHREQYPGDLFPRCFLGQAALTHRVECRARFFIPVENRSDGPLEQGVGLGGRSRGQRVVLVHDWHDQDRGPTPQAGLRDGAAPGLLPDMPFERYRGIIPDWNRFTDAVSRPETTTIRVRTGRIEPEILLIRLEGQGYRLVSIDGQPDFFRVEAESRSIALTLEHWLGLFYVQRASTGLAAPILDPNPGERVLDVGSGGGVPGVVLAVLRDDLHVSLCESVGKRAAALADIVERLELSAPVFHARAEDVLAERRFNTLTVRAVARLRKLLEWFRPHWKAFDRMLVIKGPAWAEERGETRHYGLLRDLALRKLASYPLPGTDSQSVLLQIGRKSQSRDRPRARP